MLLVRARAAGDIERVFPDARVKFTPRRDYPYRAVVSRSDVADVMAHCVQNINYGNFKKSVPTNDRHNAYLQVWWAMRRFQEEREGGDNGR